MQSVLVPSVVVVLATSMVHATEMPCEVACKMPLENEAQHPEDSVTPKTLTKSSFKIANKDNEVAVDRPLEDEVRRKDQREQEGTSRPSSWKQA